METQAETGTLTRRAVMLLGLAGASAWMARKTGSRAWADELPKGVSLKVLKETESRIAGVPKVRLIEVTFQAGAALPTTKMDQAMICECTRGTLAVELDNKKIVMMKRGEIWTCGVGTMEGVANKGPTPAIMRTFIMLT